MLDSLRHLIQRNMRRLFIGGPQRFRVMVEEFAYRFGLVRATANFSDALIPNVNLNRLSEWGKGCSFFVAPERKVVLLEALKKAAPQAASLIVAEADQACAHVFDLLGSGPTFLGEKIDWHVDFKTGHRWNPKTYYKRIRPAPYPGGYDIKVPWELSRCQHFVRLGQAYWITGDEKYAREFVAQVSDWIESNPWPWGVNWACTMDVAIRVVNWLWGYHFFKESPCLTDEFLNAFYKSLLVHGRHIWRNLENRGGFTNNHYLADLVGLVHLGILCPEFREAVEWRDFGLRELWREMFKQVYPDGVSFEASIPYHRLVTEFFLYTVILCQRNDIPVPDEVLARLEKMLEFVMYYTKPDGTVPLIGDGDNGRLVRLKAWDPPEREWVDHRYLLAIGSVLFDRLDFAQTASDHWEEAVWLFKEEALLFKQEAKARKLASLELQSRSFADAGLYIMRHENLYMAVNTGSARRNGGGGHAHHDTLSFELYVDGQTWIMDPGSYVYTADYNMRELFRGADYHNTILASLTKMPLSNKTELFRSIDRPRCVISHWESNAQRDLLDISCGNYADPEDPVELRCRFCFYKIEKLWIIQERITCAGQYVFRWQWHLHPAVEARIESDLSIIAKAPKGRYLWIAIKGSPSAKVDIIEGWVSPSYGVKRLSQVICGKYLGHFPVIEVAWSISGNRLDSNGWFIDSDWLYV